MGIIKSEKIMGRYGYNCSCPDDIMLICPICGFEYTHLEKVISLKNDDKREEVQLYFSCESNHCFSIGFRQHEGVTTFAVRSNEPPKQITHKDQYLEYLKSDQWKKKAAKKRKQAGNKCQICNRGNITLHIHHRTYENIYKEKLSDLICLCEQCHKLYHDREKKKTNG